MSPLPAMTQFGADLYAALEPIAPGDSDRGYPLGILCGGLGEPFRQVEDLVRARPGRQPWQQAFDIDACPDWQVPWVGQMVGVRVTPGADAGVQRAQVRAEAGFWRGGPQSMISAIQATLVAVPPDLAGKVLLTERSADAWTMTAVTDPAETPDAAWTSRAAQAAKVAGLVLTVSQRSVPVVDDGSRTVDLATGTIDAATFSAVT